MLQELNSILDPQSKRKYAILLLLSIASSFLQTAGVAAISLFFSVLLGGKLPEKLQSLVGSSNFVLLGIGVLVVSLSGTVTSGITTYLGLKVSWQQYERIAGELLKQYLANSYEWHLQQNSAGLINAVLGEARSVCSQLQQWVMVIVKGSEVLFMLSLLILAKPMVAIASFLTFASVYWLLFRYNRAYVREQGRRLVAANAERQKAVTEALGGIKAVKIAGNSQFFVDRFLSAAKRTTEATVNVQYFSMMPKYLIESLFFSGIVGFVVLSKYRGWGIYESIPLLALYGASALKMLPAAQQIYNSAVSLVAGQAVVQKVRAGLEGCGSALIEESSLTKSGALGPGDELFKLEKLGYRYPSSHADSLHSLDLRVLQGEKLGIVGTTGAGKTTLVDILLGLLKPASGRIAFGPEISGRDHSIAYVPQQVHFVDDSIAANIAWGIAPEEQNSSMIEQAAKKSRIHDFIATLPEGYQTMMGERGVRLSGGQRQRISLARALYLNPALLVLDEASNALDAETERQVLETLFEQDVTMIVIAHRLSTLRKCTRILVMKSGKIVSEGTYDELLHSCDFFRRLADADVGKVTAL